MALITGVTVTGASAQVAPPRPRKFLGIYNQSATDIVYVAFDQAAVAAPTAGQLTLVPIADAGDYDVGDAGLVWSGDGVPPTNGIFLISSGTATPVTIIESL